MFCPLTTETNARFGAINSFFAATIGFKDDDAATAKGLIFIQLYAVYEATVNGIVQIAIDALNAQRYSMGGIRPSLLALFLDPEFVSLQETGKKNYWKNRIKIFDRAFSDEIATLSNTTRPPNDGSHYRHTHLMMIFSVFGIKSLPTLPNSYFYRIDEVVDHRNQIAHGSETAAGVGRRYTRDEIHERISQMKTTCECLIAAFDDFCGDMSRHIRQ